MRVRFRHRRLEQSFIDAQRATRRWGPMAGARYIQRITTLMAAEKLDDLFSLRSLRLHPLRGSREGQYALTLHGRWRLIVSHSEEQSEILVEEVSHHYGD